MNSAYAIFVVLIGLTTAHHHPDMLHAGDGVFRYARSRMMGNDSVGRHRSQMSPVCCWLNSVLRHLFPTLDHVYSTHFDRFYKRL